MSSARSERPGSAVGQRVGTAQEGCGCGVIVHIYIEPCHRVVSVSNKPDWPAPRRFRTHGTLRQRRILVCKQLNRARPLHSSLSPLRERSRFPTLTTVNAYTWLDTSPTFKSSFPIPGSRTPLNVTVPFLNREFFLSSTLANVPLYTGGRILAGIDAAGHRRVRLERKHLRLFWI